MESTKDQVPSSVKTEQKRLNETKTVQLTTPTPVVEQVESTTDQDQILWKLKKKMSQRDRDCATHRIRSSRGSSRKYQ